MNIMTDVMERTYQALKRFDAHMKDAVTEPYGQRKATAKDQMDMYKNLNEAQLYDLVQKHGIESVNQWLYRMEQRSRNG